MTRFAGGMCDMVPRFWQQVGILNIRFALTSYRCRCAMEQQSPTHRAQGLQESDLDTGRRQFGDLVLAHPLQYSCLRPGSLLRRLHQGIPATLPSGITRQHVPLRSQLRQ